MTLAELLPACEPACQPAMEHTEAAEPAAKAPAGPVDAAPAAEEGVAKLILPGFSEPLCLPLLQDAAGALFIDVRSLQPKTGVCTFDPGFTSTAACESGITFTDGDAGRLLYRGYPVEQLAERGDYLDTAYLLLHGELPTKLQRRRFENEVRHHSLVHEQLIQFFKGFKHDAHPMAIMVGVAGALSAFYEYDSSAHSPEGQLEACVRLISKMPTLAALAFKTSRGLPIVYPRNDLGFAENLLYMMQAVPCEPYKVDPIRARALEKVLVLYADHEQNASTCTVRTAGSSQANPFACIASGIAALWGPAHGGANEAVLRMLMDIGGVDRIPEVIARAKDRDDPFRLYGFGHRVYKTFDPRSRVMKAVADELLEATGIDHDPLLTIAVALERAALADPYFASHRLYPNVEFYSGIVLRALGIPISMFTVIFSVARTAGWVSQWREMVNEGQHKITRPRQMYTGKLERSFVPISRRGEAAHIPDTASPTASDAEQQLLADLGEPEYLRTVSVKPARSGL
ncbi:citrate (Si)-synthase [Raphidocelis subcapitata]|uniref:Citrate synthase n=1 Tax=Raphidocelis subcapitata TaxID=307507 RepID=A0A2V0NTV9_9CHLO|nr:citrate (Si)-synthase [Raphidocelis subcapitata]|eukprot:GBF88983.1 citrate (Si)-synthase [Raphidocelis subcapitata]